MSSKNKKKSTANKRKAKEPEIICPHCGSPKFEYHKDKRRIPQKWYVHAIVAVVIIAFAFVMPYFSAAFAVVYIFFTLRKQKVIVGTCQNCGEETLFNQPADGSDKPDFSQPWL